MRADMRVGATFPDYELADQTGKRRKLSELQGSDPVPWTLLPQGPPPAGESCRVSRCQHRKEVRDD